MRLAHRSFTPARILRALPALAVFSLLLVASLRAAPAAKPKAAQPQPIYQLRVYEIFETNKAAFHARFRDHAMRIMQQRYGFEFVATWEAESDKRTEFVYLLRWPDEATMKAQWSRFMADEEWAAIKKRTGATHGRLVGEIQERVLEPTAYSPPLKRDS